jgi:hypothetical protein
LEMAVAAAEEGSVMDLPTAVELEVAELHPE